MCDTGKLVCKLLLAALVMALSIVWLTRPREPKYIDISTGDEGGAY